MHSAFDRSCVFIGARQPCLGALTWTSTPSDVPPAVCRFANPTDLNGASNWVFINSPENVQHVCMDNVRNYQRRYLPVRHSQHSSWCLRASQHLPPTLFMSLVLLNTRPSSFTLLSGL